MTDVITRVAHIRKVNLCTGGARHWFERHGLSWSEFVNNGMPASQLEATGDPLAFQVTAAAREEQVNGIG